MKGATRIFARKIRNLQLFLDLIYQQTNELRRNKKGQAHENVSLSYFVPRPGFDKSKITKTHKIENNQ